MKRLFKMTAIAVVGIVLGLFSQSCTTAKPIDKALLEGYWVLKTFESKPVVESFKGNIPNLEFNFEKNEVSGSAGCNRYFGAFTLEDDNTFKAPNLVSTMMACLEDNKEGAFLQALSAANGLKISVENNSLIFADDKTTVLEFEKGEKVEVSNAPATQGVTTDNLVGTWVVSKIQNKEAKDVFGENPATLIYAADGAVNGNAGCNTYRSKLTIAGDTITFGPMMSTKKACPNLEGEQSFTNILSTPVQASLEGNNKLVFKQNAEVVLEFDKQQE